MLSLLLALAQPVSTPSSDGPPLPPMPTLAASTGAEPVDADVPYTLPAATIERRVPGVDGRPVRSLLYTLPGEIPARRPGQPFTIAVQRWIGARIAELPQDQRAPTFICPLVPTGALVSGFSCVPERPSPHAHQLGRLIRLLYPKVAAAQPLAPIGGRGVAQARSLRFTLRLDPADWPAPWMPSGEPSLHGPPSNPLYSLMQQRWSYRFPPAALRAGASALVMADCGVEADRSISCRTASISPPASEPFFRGIVEQEMPRYLAPETLSDGRTTPGLEFRAPLRFTIAD